MKLALVTQDFPPKLGGIQTYSFELAKYFQQHAEDFQVLAPASGKGYKQYDAQSEFRTKRIHVLKDSLMTFRIWYTLQNHLNPPNVDCTFHSQFQTGPGILYSRKKIGYPTISFFGVHGRELFTNVLGTNFTLSDQYQKFVEGMFDYGDFFFPVSNFTADLLRNKGVGDDRIQVVHNGTDPEVFYPKDVTPLKQSLGLGNDKILMTVNRLVPNKGIDTVLYLMPKLIETVTDIKYVIVGDGPDRPRLEKIVDHLNIRNHVYFAGKVSAENLMDYYNLCDVFIMLSRNEFPSVEGFGIVYLEANACGKPVIGSNHGGVPEAVADEKSGFVVDESDSELIIKKLSLLFNNFELSKAMGEFGRQRIFEKFTWTHTASSIFETMKFKLEEKIFENERS